MTSFTPDHIASLGAKLDALELTEGETAALDALLAEPTAEVEGFAATTSFHATGDLWVKGSYQDRLGAVLGTGRFDDSDAVFGIGGPGTDKVMGSAGVPDL